MAFNDLTSNQMVSFTDAQSGGFSLKSGQSHVTSDQCMTKSEALTKYNVDASAMSSYANNQLVPRSVWVNGVVSYSNNISYSRFIDTSTACENRLFTNIDAMIYTSETTLANGVILYNYPNLTDPLGGINLFRVFGADRQYIGKVSPTGVLSEYQLCNPPVTPYSHLIGSNGFSDSSIGCFDDPEKVTRYSNDNILAIGSVLYTDVKLTTVFNGFGQWFKISGNLMAQILTSGEIANIIDCSPGETVSSYTYMISKGTIANGPNATCLVHDSPFQLYSDSSVINPFMVFYANKELTIRFNGNNTIFYYESGNLLIVIDGHGSLNKMYNCN